MGPAKDFPAVIEVVVEIPAGSRNKYESDEKGVDFKVLCVALADALYSHLDALQQVSPHKLLEIEQFFQTYKNLEDKSVEIEGWAGVAETLEVLRTDRERWLAEQRAAEAD